MAEGRFTELVRTKSLQPVWGGNPRALAAWPGYPGGNLLLESLKFLI